MLEWILGTLVVLMALSISGFRVMQGRDRATIESLEGALKDTRVALEASQAREKKVYPRTRATK